MTTLENLIVNPALYQEVGGTEAQPGDQVRLWLDQTIADPDLPESILGVIQNPILLTCAGTSYSVEYDETDLDASGVDLLTPDMVLSVDVVSEAEVLFAHSVRFDIDQNLTDAQRLQARDNIGLPEPLLLYNFPEDEALLQLTLALNNISPLNGLYDYVGNYLDLPMFAHIGGNVTVSGNVISGTGNAIIPIAGIPGTSNPAWMIATVVAGTPTPAYTSNNSDTTPFVFLPTFVETWYDGDTGDPLVPIECAATEVSTTHTVGKANQLAITHVNGAWVLYLCFQENPIRWKNLTDIPS